MKIVINKRKKNNLIYVMDEVSLTPLSADIVSNEQAKEFIASLLISNQKINKIETKDNTEYDSF